MNQWVLGITGLGDFHDNSAVLIDKSGKIIFASAEERFSRIKHDTQPPLKAIKAALKFGQIKPSQVEKVAVGWPQRNILKVILSNQFPDILVSILMPFLKLKLGILKELKTIFESNQKKHQVDWLAFPFSPEKIVFVDHYRAHASSAYRTSGFKKCLAVAMDGFGAGLDGDLYSGAAFICQDGKMKEVERIPVWASLGLFYEAITNALGFKPADGEGKTMGLATYGNPKKVYKELKKFAPQFKKDSWQKGKNWADQFFSVSLFYKKAFVASTLGTELEKLIKNTSYEDVAAAAQRILEEEAIAYFKYLIKKYGPNNFAVAGGIFLNVKMNMRLCQIGGVKDFFVHPQAGDGGVALGAALEVVSPNPGKRITSVAWGESFTDKEIREALRKYQDKIVFEKKKDITTFVGERLTQGKVIGWFQGRAEWGPRALGQRSVLADPREPKLKDKINLILKKREYFMPFAPSIMVEHIDDYFAVPIEEPFMVMAFDVLPGKEKEIQAAIHIDNTARPNTVNKKVNPLYWQVINAFYQKTGVPVILNTSFNKHGLPIVNTPKEAIEHLLWGSVDELAIGRFYVRRKQ